MIVDAYTKAVLTVIAVALVLIAAQPLYAPARAKAQMGDAYKIEMSVSSIESDVQSIRSDVNAIAHGICVNGKLC